MEIYNIYGVDSYQESKYMDTLANKEHRFHHSVHHHIHDTEERLTEKLIEHDEHLAREAAAINANIDSAESNIISEIASAKSEILANQSSMLSTIQGWL